MSQSDSMIQGESVSHMQSGSVSQIVHLNARPYRLHCFDINIDIDINITILHICKIDKRETISYKPGLS